MAASGNATTMSVNTNNYSYMLSREELSQAYKLKLENADIFAKYYKREVDDTQLIVYKPQAPFKCKEEYWDDKNSKSKNEMTNAQFYILTDAFNELREEINGNTLAKEMYPKTKGFAYEDSHAFQSNWDYTMTKFDDKILTGVDIASVILGFVGLDFVADGAGTFYALIRGRYSDAALNVVSFFIPGPEGTVAVKGGKVACDGLLKVVDGVVSVADNLPRRKLWELAENLRKDGVLSKSELKKMEGMDVDKLSEAIGKCLNKGDFDHFKIRVQSLDKGGEVDALIGKVESLSEGQQKEFGKMFSGLNEPGLMRFVDNPDMVDVWKKLYEVKTEKELVELRKIMEDIDFLEPISKYPNVCFDNIDRVFHHSSYKGEEFFCNFNSVRDKIVNVIKNEKLTEQEMIELLGDFEHSQRYLRGDFEHMFGKVSDIDRFCLCHFAARTKHSLPTMKTMLNAFFTEFLYQYLVWQDKNKYKTPKDFFTEIVVPFVSNPIDVDYFNTKDNRNNFWGEVFKATASSFFSGKKSSMFASCLSNQEWSMIFSAHNPSNILINIAANCVSSILWSELGKKLKGNMDDYPVFSQGIDNFNQFWSDGFNDVLKEWLKKYFPIDN